MTPLSWFKEPCSLVDDERIRLLAFEDRWHYVALKCCKGQGIIDNTPALALLRRKLGVKLGLDPLALDAMMLRLAELELVDPRTFQPLDWQRLQGTSALSTSRVQAFRARKKAAGASETGETFRNATDYRGSSSYVSTTTEETGETLHGVTCEPPPWPAWVDIEAQAAISRQLGDLPPDQRLQLLEELAGQVKPLKNPVGWISSLLARLEAGLFIPAAGPAWKKRREQQAAKEEEQALAREQQVAEAKAKAEEKAKLQEKADGLSDDQARALLPPENAPPREVEAWLANGRSGCPHIAAALRRALA